MARQGLRGQPRHGHGHRPRAARHAAEPATAVITVNNEEIAELVVDPPRLDMSVGDVARPADLRPARQRHA